MYKKFLLFLASICISAQSPLNAHVVACSELVHNETGQTILLASDNHSSVKPKNQVNDKQFQTLLTLAKKEDAFVLVEDGNLFHIGAIEDWAEKGTEHLFSYDELDAAWIKKLDSKDLVSILKTDPQTSVLHYAACTFRAHDIPVKNVEWRFPSQCLNLITPTQYFERENTIIEKIRNWAEGSVPNMQFFITNTLDSILKKRDNLFGEWLEAIRKSEGKMLDECIELTNFKDTPKSYKLSLLGATYCVYDLFDLNLLFEIDQLKEEKTILVIAGLLHTHQIQNWLLQMGYELKTEVKSVESIDEMLHLLDLWNQHFFIREYPVKEELTKLLLKIASSLEDSDKKSGLIDSILNKTCNDALNDDEELFIKNIFELDTIDLEKTLVDIET